MRDSSIHIKAGRILLILALLVMLAALSTPAISSPFDGNNPAPVAAAPAQQADRGIPAIGMPLVVPSSFDGDVRNLPQVPAKPYHMWEVREPESEKQKPLKYAFELDVPNNVLVGDMPTPSQNFAGLAFNDTCTGGQCGAGWPPDVVGQIGLNYYIEAVNDAWGIYSKSGTLLASFTEDAIWGTSGTNPCSNGNNMGDPIVIYDMYSDRWILTNFAFALDGSNNPIAPFYQCFVVSKTSDPISGGWWLYALQMDPGGTGKPPSGTLNDYPKFGLWPDCLYMASNEFTMPAGSFAGTAFASLSYRDMEKGAPLTWALGYETSGNIYTMVPSTVNGNTPAAQPPAGRPNYFVQESQLYWGYELRPFTAGANCGSGGSLGAMTLVSQATYSSPCGATNCNVVSQPGTTIKLDSLGDRVMNKVQYRNVAGVESLWVVHSVRSATNSTVRPQWAQINVTGGTISTTPVQEQIYAPDTTINRWMSSIAADNAGNAAMGFSTGNGTAPNYPSISYAGRLVGDTLGTMGQGETQLYAGTGSQTSYSRWGDYTEMSVDPADDCTFWYTDEYLSATGTVWRTRIGAFRYTTAQCVSSPVATTNHTLIFNGGTGSDWNATSERLGTAPTSGTTFDYYASYDASNLYLGVKGSAEGQYTYVAVVDTDPNTQTSANTGATAALACAGGFSAHGKGDYALVRTGAAQSSGSVGSTAKYNGTSGSWAAWSPTASTDAGDLGRNEAEFQIAWSDIGLAPTASPIGVYLYVCSGSSVISAWPPENVQTGSPTLNVETMFNTHDTGRTPRTYAWHSGDETRSLTATGAYSFLNGYVQLNVTAVSGASCSFEARVLGNRDTTDTAIIRRGYRLTPSNCTTLTANVTLKYEDGTTANNVPSELNGLAEGTLNLLRRSPSWVDLGATSRDTTANTVTLNGVTSFSWWSLGVGNHAPTALEVGPASVGTVDVTSWVLLGAVALLACGALVLMTRRRPES